MVGIWMFVLTFEILWLDVVYVLGAALHGH